MIHYAAAHARQIQREPDTFWLSRLRKGPGMQYVNSIFGELLKPIDRRQFREIVERHDGNAYDKSFKSWDHVVTMVGAQLGRVGSLRAVEATVKANSHQHYHLGVGKAPRSTLSVRMHVVRWAFSWKPSPCWLRRPIDTREWKEPRWFG